MPPQPIPHLKGIGSLEIELRLFVIIYATVFLLLLDFIHGSAISTKSSVPYILPGISPLVSGGYSLY